MTVAVQDDSNFSSETLRSPFVIYGLGPWGDAVVQAVRAAWCDTRIELHGLEKDVPVMPHRRVGGITLVIFDAGDVYALNRALRWISVGVATSSSMVLVVRGGLRMFPDQRRGFRDRVDTIVDLPSQSLPEFALTATEVLLASLLRPGFVGICEADVVALLARREHGARAAFVSRYATSSPQRLMEAAALLAADCAGHSPNALIALFEGTAETALLSVNAGAERVGNALPPNAEFLLAAPLRPFGAGGSAITGWLLSDPSDEESVARFLVERLELRKVGRSLRGRCPFHEEKSPSFHVTPAVQRYRCFGCGTGGTTHELAERLERIVRSDGIASDA